MTIDRFWKEHSGLKRSGSWYVVYEDVMIVSNLQKSQFGAKYYFNLGIWLVTVGGANKYPRQTDCHIWGRFGQFISADRAAIQTLLDLENGMADDARERDLWRLLTEDLLPIVKRADSLPHVLEMFRDGCFAQALMTPEARELARVQAPFHEGDLG